jgi:hypothetical protein
MRKWWIVCYYAGITLGLSVGSAKSGDFVSAFLQLTLGTIFAFMSYSALISYLKSKGE